MSTDQQAASHVPAHAIAHGTRTDARLEPTHPCSVRVRCQRRFRDIRLALLHSNRQSAIVEWMFTLELHGGISA